MWWWGVLTGILLTLSWQVCYRGMNENDADDSWESIMRLERAEGR